MRTSLLLAFAALFLPLSAFAMGFGSDSSGDNSAEPPPYEMAFQKTEMGQFGEAQEILRDLVMKEPENADAWNLLGFSYRNMGETDAAWDAYERALTIDPNHKGAHEYLGQWYLEQDDLASARAQLEKLITLCPTGCEERSSLAGAIVRAASNS